MLAAVGWDAARPGAWLVAPGGRARRARPGRHPRQAHLPRVRADHARRRRRARRRRVRDDRRGLTIVLIWARVRAPVRRAARRPRGRARPVGDRPRSSTRVDAGRAGRRGRAVARRPPTLAPRRHCVGRSRARRPASRSRSSTRPRRGAAGAIADDRRRCVAVGASGLVAWACARLADRALAPAAGHARVDRARLLHGARVRGRRAHACSPPRRSRCARRRTRAGRVRHRLRRPRAAARARHGRAADRADRRPRAAARRRRGLALAAAATQRAARSPPGSKAAAALVRCSTSRARGGHARRPEHAGRRCSASCGRSPASAR